jgi:hypothetical protein
MGRVMSDRSIKAAHDGEPGVAGAEELCATRS